MITAGYPRVPRLNSLDNMNVLFTGMGSHHCKKPDNVSFFGVLDEAISRYANVVWSSPNVAWKKEDLEKYDLIVFGFMPPTSLSANKLYGALNVLSLMFDSPKLKLVVDSPQIWQYKNSINASIKNPSILLGNFYARREGYEAATRNKTFVEKALAHMMVSTWPEILYPAMPWNSSERVAEALSFVGPERLKGVYADSFLMDPEPARIGRSDIWAVENPKNTWAQLAAKGLSFPQQATKLGRKTDDDYAKTVIESSVGLLLPPQERNDIIWWNYRISQALNTSTPVVTYWPETRNFSQSWAMLGYQVEDMSPAQRQVLASTQRNVYLDYLPTAEEALIDIRDNLLGSIQERI